MRATVITANGLSTEAISNEAISNEAISNEGFSNEALTGTRAPASQHPVQHLFDRRSHLRVRAAVAAALFAATSVAATAPARATDPIAAKTPAKTAVPITPAPPQTTEQKIATLERSVAVAPANAATWRDLGAAYVRRAYETADPSYYPLAERALTRAARLLPNSAEVFALQAGLGLARHQFAAARTLAGRALGLRPDAFDARVALIDAQIELGHYDDAAGELDRLLDQRAGVAALSRLSYLRQLKGDALGAEAAMRQAVIAAPAGSLDRSVTQAYLGDLLMEKGDVAAAARAYDAALAITPTSATATMGRARLLASKGRLADAARLLDALTQRVPLPGALGLRSDVARAAKDRQANIAADQLVDASIALFQANGAVVDSELAILLADRGPAAGRAAVVAARRAYGERTTIFTADALAWSLFVSGDPAAAEPYAREAIARSPLVASVHWHAARVFQALGKTTEATDQLRLALRNPWFSLSQHADLVAMSTTLGVRS